MISPEVLRRYACFAGIGDATLKAVAMISEERAFPAGSTLFHEGEPANHLFVVTEGEVDIRYAMGEGESRSVDVLVAGEIMVWSALVPPHKTHSTAVARKDTRVIAIEAAKLRKLCEEDSALGLRMMTAIAEAVSQRLHGARLQLASV